MKLTTNQFRQLSDLVYKEIGINLHDGKQQLLQARIARRLRSTGIGSVDVYLKKLARDPQELVHFLDAVSTNHTYFFRESHHFECLVPKHTRIWCSAASSGEEPYSIAIHCLEKGFSPTIFATDISTKTLALAHDAVYPIERIRNIPQTLVKKYFKKGHGRREGYVKVKDEIRRMVIFRRFNLICDALPTKEFDVIFCRNVLIYFDNAVKERVVNRMYPLLCPEGYLIIGGAESLNMITHPYKYVRPSVYVKR